MPRRPTTNCARIREMCRQRFPTPTDEFVVELQAIKIARTIAAAKVDGFEREGDVAAQALEEVVAAAAQEAAEIAVRETHHDAAREAVAKEAAAAALREIRHEAAMETLRAVAKEAATISVRELRDCMGGVGGFIVESSPASPPSSTIIVPRPASQ